MPNAIRCFVRLALVFWCALAACSNPVQTSVVVEWTTATEINTAGFNLYRSDNAAGPYIKVNGNLIPASSDPVRGNQYRYEDRSVIAGKTYYYRLEDVELTGTAAQHGPIQVTAGSNDGIGMVVLGAVVGGFLVFGVVVALTSRQRAKPIRSVDASSEKDV